MGTFVLLFVRSVIFVKYKLDLNKKECVHLAEVKRTTGLKIVSEVVDIRTVEYAAKYVDVLQIGARNMQNFALLKEIGRVGKPVLLKRGLAATLDEWLNAAEYILAEGNSNVVLCERGIRTYERYTRNTLDLSAVPALKHLSHLPVIVDPSHGTGKWRLVRPMAMAAIMAGADGGGACRSRQGFIGWSAVLIPKTLSGNDERSLADTAAIAKRGFDS